RSAPPISAASTPVECRSAWSRALFGYLRGVCQTNPAPRTTPQAPPERAPPLPVRSLAQQSRSFDQPLAHRVNVIGVGRFLSGAPQIGSDLPPMICRVDHL